MRFVPLCFLALVATAGLTSLAHAQAIGRTDKVEASVTARNSDGLRPLADKDLIIFNDELTTGKGARLQGTLDDGTQLTLGESARLVIDDFVYDPNKPGGALDIKVKKGAFLFVGGKVEAKSGARVSITTPVVTLGVRGTTVWGGSIDGGYGVLVLSGEVEVKSKHGTVLLKSGQGTMVYGDKAPEKAGAWPDDRTKRAVATISFKAQPTR